MDDAEIGSELERHVARLRVDASGGQRKPHKPLLLLYAIGRILVHDQDELSYEQVDAALVPLLGAYAPPVKSKPHPEYPFWHLRTDGLWEVPGAESLRRGANGYPLMSEFRRAMGRLPERYVRALRHDRGLARRVVGRLLDEHFEPSLHEDVLAAVGLDRGELDTGPMLDRPNRVAEEDFELVLRRRRAARFRDEVLTAYDRRCAVTGFQARIGGQLFGVEAAHVHWHSQGGPCSVSNGIALNPVLHTLFDHGAWTLSDDRRVLVSRDFTGSEAALDALRPLHGRPLRAPEPGRDPVALEFLRWHREPDRGGVFRWPPIPL